MPQPRARALTLALTLGLTMITPMLHAATAATPAGAESPAATVTAANPLLKPSTLEFQYPHFDLIRDSHFGPALEAGMAEQQAEVQAIATQKDQPSFENTIVALEKSGQTLLRTANIFFNLTGAHTNPELERIQGEMAPKLAAHQDAIVLNSALFARIQALYAERDALNLDAESKRLLERYHTDFVRAGARLDEAQKTQLKALNADIATLQTQFSQNVLKEVNASALIVKNKKALAGLSDEEIATAAKAAEERGLKGQYVIPLLNTTGQPALASLTNRKTREALLQASMARGTQGGEFDNTAIIARLVKARAERAQLLGYPNHATYVLEDETAQTVERVNGLMSDMAPAAVRNAKQEAADMQKLVDAAKGGFKIGAADWALYSEKVRAERYAFDESQLRPYFELDRVLIDGVFYAAGQLYGLSFRERTDLPVYQEDVRVFDVLDADGSKLGIFIADLYARPSKRGGAWMNEYMGQSGLLGTHPVVGNHLNIPKPPKGEPTLLTFDEVTTLFHEFGHALHGLFSDVKYPRFAGTNVPRDFVEYPSQVNEMWAVWPQVLKNYAKHHKTGEPLPQALLDKVLAASKFNQGYATTEYLAAAMLDQAWHQISPDQAPAAKDVLKFEADALKAAGLDYAAVPPRYRSGYFSHVFAGGYSAGYYAYLWSEVLDAESVLWFKENGGLTRKNGDHFRATLLSRGGSDDAIVLFKNFRGREASVEPLLEKRGLK